MEGPKEQIKLLQRRRLIINDDFSWKIGRDHLDYLRHYFFSKKRHLTMSAVIYLVLQGFLEVALIFISHRYLSGNSSLVSYSRLFIVIVVCSAVYLWVSFMAIKQEKTLVVWLVNDLRLKWFQRSLGLDVNHSNISDKGNLLAKISYHLPLLTAGVSNSLVGCMRWLILFFVSIFLIFIFGGSFTILIIASVLISVLVAVAAFFVSKNYVSREVTFASKMIKLVDFSLSDWQFTKIFNREKQTIADFNYLVELDSFSRIRRNLWMRFGASIIFVLLLFSGWLAGVFNEQLLSFVVSSGSLSKYTFLIIAIYFSRLLYESLRVGLYSVPFILGLILSIPQTKGAKLYTKRPFKGLEIIFQVSKIKLFRGDNKYHSFNFNFKKGKSYLITGGSLSGKSSLAKLFVGRTSYGRRAWVIKADQNRFFYNDFFKSFYGFYFLDPDFKSSHSVLEVILGKEKIRINDQDILRISKLINERPEWQEIFFEKDDLRLPADVYLGHHRGRLILQALHCLERKPYFLVIDNYWLDRGDVTINHLLNILRDSLPETIFVFFSTVKDVESKKAVYLDYEKHYEI